MAEATRLAEEGVEAVAAPPAARRSGWLRDAALIAEVIGAVAVVISLIFVGIQVALANDLARDAAEQKQIESMGRTSFPPGSER